jgi:phosphatidylinositol alpha-1,6-mannosyltransferase
VRVLIVTNDLPPQIGGIQYYVDQLARGLVAAGDDVTLFGSTPRTGTTDEDWRDHDATAPFRVVRERTSVLLPTPRVLRHTESLIAATGAEVVVFGATVPLAFMGGAITRRTGVPTVCWTHGLEVSAVRMPGSGPILRRIGRSTAAITYVSHWCRDLLSPAFGTDVRSELLPPAIDPSEFHADVDGTGVRARHGLGDRPVVVCVSRLVARKGQDQLIRALPALRRRVPGTALLVVGGGPHRQALEELARELGMAEHVVFTGIVDEEELPAHYAAGDVFAMPCRERRGGFEVEAFGIVFIQAQAVGVPVVAGDIGGVPDSVGGPDDGGGVLVDGTDLAAVTDAVGRLLEDRALARRLGARGAARVADGFTWPARTVQLRRLLAEVAAGAADARP